MKSLEELKAIKEKMRGQVEFRSEDGVWTEDNPYRKHVLVCGGTGCTSSGSKKIIEKLHEEIRKNSLENEIGVVKTGCFGLCALGPIMIVYPEGAFYSMVKEEDIPEELLLVFYIRRRSVKMEYCRFKRRNFIRNKSELRFATVA